MINYYNIYLLCSKIDIISLFINRWNENFIFKLHCFSEYRLLYSISSFDRSQWGVVFYLQAFVDRPQFDLSWRSCLYLYFSDQLGLDTFLLYPEVPNIDFPCFYLKAWPLCYICWNIYASNLIPLSFLINVAIGLCYINDNLFIENQTQTSC